MMKSKITIFETNKNDSIMSKDPKFYEEGLSEEERKERFHQQRIKLGKKLGIDGNHIFKAYQKGQYNDYHKDAKYEDGTYIVLNESHMNKEDFYDEYLPADILIISDKYPKIAIANPQADCAILICEDREKGYTALSHCGAAYVDRNLPIDTIKALEKHCNSQKENIYVYIGSCIKKESYIYDKYPVWAKNKKIWEKNIEEKNNEYYSHSVASKGDISKKGQNLVGFYYNERRED